MSTVSTGLDEAKLSWIQAILHGARGEQNRRHSRDNRVVAAAPGHPSRATERSSGDPRVWVWLVRARVIAYLLMRYAGEPADPLLLHGRTRRTRCGRAGAARAIDGCPPRDRGVLRAVLMAWRGKS